MRMPANVIDVIRQMLADQRIDASTPQHGSSREADFVSSISWLDRPSVRSNGFIVSKRLTGRELLAIHAAPPLAGASRDAMFHTIPRLLLIRKCLYSTPTGVSNIEI